MSIMTSRRFLVTVLLVTTVSSIAIYIAAAQQTPTDDRLTGNWAVRNLGTTDGGCVDNPFRWCDNIDNVDPANFTLVSKAFANTVARMASDTKVMSASNDYITKSKPKIGGGASRKFPAK